MKLIKILLVFATVLFAFNAQAQQGVRPYKFKITNVCYSYTKNSAGQFTSYSQWKPFEGIITMAEGDDTGTSVKIVIYTASGRQSFTMTEGNSNNDVYPATDADGTKLSVQITNNNGEIHLYIAYRAVCWVYAVTLI